MLLLLNVVDTKKCFEAARKSVAHTILNAAECLIWPGKLSELFEMALKYFSLHFLNLCGSLCYSILFPFLPDSTFSFPFSLLFSHLSRLWIVCQVRKRWISNGVFIPFIRHGPLQHGNAATNGYTLLGLTKSATVSLLCMAAVILSEGPGVHTHFRVAWFQAVLINLN